MSAGDLVGAALVVGCSGTTLRGVAHDVRAMAAMLRTRGLAVDVRAGADATRASILDGYDRLIARARPDQPAVVYYTGHGFYAYRDDEARPWQGICPADIAASTAEDFRGITAWELSIKLAQLTRRTRNVTVILDCCHASLLSREGALRGGTPRVLPHPVRVSFAAHLAALRAMYGDDFDAVEPTGDRDAVRVVACGQGETAFEYEAHPGDHRGAFTDALLRVLDDVGSARVSWAAIEGAIRSRVFDRFPTQRPGVDGPARRLVFSLTEDPHASTAMIVAVPGGFEIGAGRLMGVSRGDVYGVMPSGSPGYCAGDAIAEVEVRETFATVALATLRRWVNDHTELRHAAVGVPIERQPASWPVRVVAPAAATARVLDALAATGSLRAAGPDDAALATLQIAGATITVADPIGSLCHPLRFPDQLAHAMATLVNLGAARRVRELEGEHGVSATELAVEWGVIEGGEPRRMPDRGAALGSHHRVYVRVASAAQRPLYVHIFDIGLAGAVRLVTQDLAAAGVPLRHEHAELVLGQHSDGVLDGLALGWPAEVPRSVARVEELIVVATTMPASLRDLETEDLLGARAPHRGARGGLAEFDGFYAKRLSWILCPQNHEVSDTPFELGSNPLR